MAMHRMSTESAFFEEVAAVGGKAEGEMKSFFEQHLLSLMRPTAQHVRELNDVMNTLKSQIHTQGTAIDTVRSRLDQHDHQLCVVGGGLAQADKRVTDMHSEICRSIVDKTQVLQMNIDDVWKKTEEQFRDVKVVLENLKMSCQTTDACIAQLQKGASEAKVCTLRLSEDFSEMDKTLENLRHEHLGMSDRLEQTKRYGEDNCHNLARLELNVGAKHSKFEETCRRFNKRCQLLEEKVSQCCINLADHEQLLGSQGEGLRHAMNELVLIQGELAEDKKQNQELAVSLRNLNIRQCIELLFQKIEHANEEAVKLQQSLIEDQGNIRILRRNLDSTIEDVSKHATDLVRLDKTQQNFGHQHRHAVDRLTRQEEQHGLLKERVSVAELGIKGILKFQGEASSHLDEIDRHLRRADVRSQDIETRLDGNDGQLKILYTQLAANGEATAKTAMGLDLAHEYLNGVSKGLQGAHKHVVFGQEDMLPYKKGAPRTLPSLPGSNSHSAPSPDLHPGPVSGG